MRITARSRVEGAALTSGLWPYLRGYSQAHAIEEAEPQTSAMRRAQSVVFNPAHPELHQVLPRPTHPIGGPRILANRPPAKSHTFPF